MIKQLWIEPSGFCNLNCSMCGGNPRQKQFTKKTGILSLKDFKLILNKFLDLSSGLKKVDFRGTGEPLMNNELSSMISYCKEKGLLTGITTNGSLLTAQKNAELLQTGLDYLTLSIESVDRKTYEKIRFGAKLENVKRNIENFIKQNDKIKSKCKVVFNTVLQEMNVKQIQNIINYGASIGINAFCLLNLENEYRKNNFTIIENEKICGVSYKRLKQKFNSWKKLANDLKIELFLPPINANLDKNCVFNWSAPIITCDGHIEPCCRMQELKYKMGNILKQDLKGIWNNKKYLTFRKGKYKFCQFCLLYLDRFKNIRYIS